MKRQRAGPLITEKMIVFAQGLYTARQPPRWARLLIDFPISRLVFLFSAQVGHPQGWIPWLNLLSLPRCSAWISVRVELSFIHHSFIQHARVQHLLFTGHSANSRVPIFT